MKTNNLYITLFAALAITACSKDNELPQGSAKDPNADMPDAYTSIAINIPHTTMTKATSGRAIDQGIADENKVKTLRYRCPKYSDSCRIYGRRQFSCPQISR